MLTNYIKPEQRFIVCPNQDVVYGAGFTALDNEPTVFQVPDFGDRFYVYALYDARTDEIARIGKQYGTKPGFYMIVGRELEGRGAAGNHRGGRARPRTSCSSFPRFQGRHGERHEGHSAAAQPDRDVSLEPVRRKDEDRRTAASCRTFPVPPAPVAATPNG